ncbi:hypothetical protein J1N35_011027 [Gossypium stocksii]|uniref:Uncharacterized protein n=1 Tax=Gossypium stocksii TaxID=47602 RepID=A0A9D3W1G0_9ROSI|nr:hypothetical protein J1N35_011027 [Gossypium stocksii]
MFGRVDWKLFYTVVRVFVRYISTCKNPSFMQREKGLENDINIYMQPLIEELKQLWAGVKTYDALRKENFYLRTALLWTINDFLAYANLSGWSTKGDYACLCCAVQTCSKWLYNGKKFSYMGHNRWLDENHRFRFQMTLFDGTKEFRKAPE